MLQTLGTYNFYIYILTNKAKTVLYIGFTTNLQERLHFHKNPEPHSKSFTAKYKCFNLLYYEHYDNVDIAIERETQLKKWRRDKKVKLITDFNPEWRFLNDDI